MDLTMIMYRVRGRQQAEHFVLILWQIFWIQGFVWNMWLMGANCEQIFYPLECITTGRKENSFLEEKSWASLLPLFPLNSNWDWNRDGRGKARMGRQRNLKSLLTEQVQVKVPQSLILAWSYKGFQFPFLSELCGVWSHFCLFLCFIALSPTNSFTLYLPDITFSIHL